jgi:lipoate-protein ligase A
MRWLELTAATPPENLALDEALLVEAETGKIRGEVLRIWEPAQTFVVLGRSSRRADEVDLDACRRSGVAVYRRCSGGSTVLVGPGCLMYSLVLNCDAQPALRGVAAAHEHVLARMLAALRPLQPGIAAAGTSDLVLGERKFSGNSLRCLRDHILYHGTILYDLPLDLIGRCLRWPARQPEYRRGRVHRDFLANLPLGREQIRDVLRTAWQAEEPMADWPQAATLRLAREKYSTPQWNEKL